MKIKWNLIGGMMRVSDWNVVVSESGDVKLIWKGKVEGCEDFGEKVKGSVFVKMKMKGKGRWFVFKGELKFDGIEDDESK
jgi:hypothetical protein